MNNDRCKTGVRPEAYAGLTDRTDATPEFIEQQKLGLAQLAVTQDLATCMDIEAELKRNPGQVNERLKGFRQSLTSRFRDEKSQFMRDVIAQEITAVQDYIDNYNENRIGLKIE